MPRQETCVCAVLIIGYMVGSTYGMAGGMMRMLDHSLPLSVYDVPDGRLSPCFNTWIGLTRMACLFCKDVETCVDTLYEIQRDISKTRGFLHLCCECGNSQAICVKMVMGFEECYNKEHGR